jgi:hypothetical protein
MRFIIALSAAILSTASVAYAATDRGYDPMAAGHVVEGRSVFDGSPMASPLLSPIGSSGTTDGRVCGHARHRLFDECVSAWHCHIGQE